MHQLKLTTAMAFLCTALLSCQKEISEEAATGGSAGSGSIAGTYRFVSIESASVATVTLRDGTDLLKTVTYNEYRTKNNGGTVKIDGGTMNATDLTYTVESIAKAYTYVNNTLEDSVEAPVNFTLPLTRSSTAYQLVGSDSIAFTSGAALIGSNPQLNGAPNGGRYKLEGNDLYFIHNINQTTTQDMQGIAVQTNSQAKLTMHLRKQ